MREESLVNSQSKINSGTDGRKSESSDDLGKDAENESSKFDNEIALHRVKLKLEEFQSNILLDVKHKMDRMVEDIIQEIKLYELNSSQFKDFAKQQTKHIWSNRVKVNGNETTNLKILPEKVFIDRQSYLTSLLKVSHMRGIYHIFFVMFSVIFLNMFVHDLVEYGRWNFGLTTIQTGFGKFHIAMAVWFGMQSSVLLFYFVFKLWAYVQFVLRKNPMFRKIWNYSALVMFVTYQLIFGYIPAWLTVSFDLPLISSTVVLLEMARFMMKVHSFVRTNVPFQLHGKRKIDDYNESPLLRAPFPHFGNYLYFLFAPTLIYRDSYPRTKQIRWTFAAKSFLEVIAVIFFITFIHERYLRPYFADYGKEQITLGQLTAKLFGMVPPGLMIYLGGFYCILHAWQNFTAELLQFADRMFYKDWWTANNFAAFFRDWNILVHDWLYEYIYKDLYVYVFRGSKSASAVCVILISAIVHEYLIDVAFRFCYPVLLAFFGGVSVSLLLLLGKSSNLMGNLVLWWGLGVGNGLMVSLYSMEYYARQNCPVGNTWKDLFVPVSWWCNGINDSS